MCPKNIKVLALKGSRNVYEVEHALSKTNITVMFTFSVAGSKTHIAQSIPVEMV